MPAVVIQPLPPVEHSYRKAHQDKTIAVMLYGFDAGANGAANGDDVPIPKKRKALSAFFHQHIDRVKRDYLTRDPSQMQIVTGEAAFNSTQLNRGPGLEPAKMAGVTVPAGRLTFGGGYTWGEKNPALMVRNKAEGMFVGASYDTGNAGYQLSYLTSGQDIAGVEIGSTDIRYDSLMLGTSFRVNRRMGVTATVQYRNDKDPLTTGEKQTVFTIGTRWKF